MLTKTGELIMRKKPQQFYSRFSPSIRDSYQPLKLRSHSQISHINEYNFISVSNIITDPHHISKEMLQQLEVQNFRLIEQNMRLLQWSRGLLARTRQSILRVIQGIEQFRYLQSVNKLYEVIGEIAEYQEKGVQVTKLNSKENYLNLKRINNLERKLADSSNFFIKKLHFFTYDPKDKPQNKKMLPDNDKPQKQGDFGEKVFLPEKMKADFSDFQPTTSQAAMFHMLLMQSLCIQSMVESQLK